VSLNRSSLLVLFSFKVHQLVHPIINTAHVEELFNFQQKRLHSTVPACLLQYDLAT